MDKDISNPSPHSPGKVHNSKGGISYYEEAKFKQTEQSVSKSEPALNTETYKL